MLQQTSQKQSHNPQIETAQGKSKDAQSICHGRQFLSFALPFPVRMVFDAATRRNSPRGTCAAPPRTRSGASGHGAESRDAGSSPGRRKECLLRLSSDARQMICKRPPDCAGGLCGSCQTITRRGCPMRRPQALPPQPEQPRPLRFRLRNAARRSPRCRGRLPRPSPHGLPRRCLPGSDGRQ